MDPNGADAAESLRILAADEDESALERLTRILEALGHEVTSSAVDLAEATEAIAREDPDASIVLVHADDEHALALIEEITAFSRGPVIALLAEDEPGFLGRAAERGISAFARGVDPDAIQAALDLAMRQHVEQQRLVQKVDQLEHALDRRAVIERAKGILMERYGLDERAAFERMRGHARSTNQAVVDVAGAVTKGHGLLSSSGHE
jgi:response regulator NasT